MIFISLCHFFPSLISGIPLGLFVNSGLGLSRFIRLECDLGLDNLMAGWGGELYLCVKGKGVSTGRKKAQGALFDNLIPIPKIVPPPSRCSLRWVMDSIWRVQDQETAYLYVWTVDIRETQVLKRFLNFGYNCR